MRLSIQQEVLAYGLSIVGCAVASRNTLSVLGNVLLDAGDKRLTLVSTDLAMSLTWFAEFINVEEQGELTVPFRTLSDYVAALPGELVHLDADIERATLHLECTRNKADIKGIPASEFPERHPFPDNGTISLEAELFAEMVTQVVVAAATDTSRPVLEGILVDILPEKGTLTLVAADGFRLAVRCEEVDKSTLEAIGEGQIVVPAAALREMARFVQKSGLPVEMALGDGKVFFRCATMELASSLIEYPYPDVQQIVPTKHTTQVEVDVAELMHARQLASVFAREHANKLIVLDIRDDNTIVVSATSAETGDQTGIVVAEVEGEGLSVGFNADYLKDALDYLGTEKVVMELTTPTSPVVFRLKDGVDLTHVLMPHHLNR